MQDGSVEIKIVDLKIASSNLVGPARNKRLRNLGDGVIRFMIAIFFY